MSVGGGGFGGGGLPPPGEALELWGGRLREHPVPTPAAAAVLKEDGSGRHIYGVVAVGVQGDRTPPSTLVTAADLATLRWDSVPGADAYVVVRDGLEVTGPIHIGGLQKVWTDMSKK